MPKSWSDEAIVLRTYNVGETDRFCILLTRHHGRLAARANGARRLLSRRGSGLLPFHRLQVLCEVHSFGTVVASASCLDAYTQSWCDPQGLSSVSQGFELLLALTDDASPLPQVFDLTCAFLAASSVPSATIALPLFMIRLLDALGFCPSLLHSSHTHRPFRADDSIVFSSRYGGLVSLEEDRSARRLSSELVTLLRTADRLPLDAAYPVDELLLQELFRFVYSLIGNHVGSPMRAPDVSLAISSADTPICHVSGLAS